jgi:hypothetical protein
MLASCCGTRNRRPRIARFTAGKGFADYEADEYLRSAVERQPDTMIRDHIAANLTIEPDDFEYAPFSQQGGLGKVHQLFGDKVNTIIEESNESLAA